MGKFISAGMIIGLCLAIILSGCGGVVNNPAKSYSTVTKFFNYTGDALGITFDASGNLFVTSGAAVYKLSAATGSQSTFLSASAGECLAGIIDDGAGNLYISDSYKNVLYTSAEGNTTGVPAPFYSVLGTFSQPMGLAVDSFSLYVADCGHNKIAKLSLSDKTVWGVIPVTSPWAVALDKSANVYCCNPNSNVISKFSPSGTTTLFTITDTHNTPGLIGLALDQSGNIYAADCVNYVIWKVTPSGTCSVFAGTDGTSGNTGGPLLSAKFGYLYSIAIDANGNIYVGDHGNQCIWKIAYQ